MDWRKVNKFISQMFSSQPIKGSANMAEVMHEATFYPRPWHDQRGIINGTDPQQPAAIDLSDLERMN